MPFAMEDPLKVFLGSLWPEINKPRVKDRLREMGLEFIEVFVPQLKPGASVGIAFVICGTIADAANILCHMSDLEDFELSPSKVKAARTNIGASNLSLRCVFSCMYLVSLRC